MFAAGSRLPGNWAQASRRTLRIGIDARQWMQAGQLPATPGSLGAGVGNPVERGLQEPIPPRPAHLANRQVRVTFSHPWDG